MPAVLQICVHGTAFVPLHLVPDQLVNLEEDRPTHHGTYQQKLKEGSWAQCCVWPDELDDWFHVSIPVSVGDRIREALLCYESSALQIRGIVLFLGERVLRRGQLDVEVRGGKNLARILVTDRNPEVPDTFAKIMRGESPSDDELRGTGDVRIIARFNRLNPRLLGEKVITFNSAGLVVNRPQARVSKNAPCRKFGE